MNRLEKVENKTQVKFQVLEVLNLGLDEVAREKAREQLGLNPLENISHAEEDEILMFLLCRSVLY